MNPSIRKYLLINLLLGVTIIILLTAIVNYYLAQQDIEKHLDMLLSQSAYAIQALVSDDYHKRDLKKLQSAIDVIPHKVKKTLKKYNKKHPNANYPNTFEFQVWSPSDLMILRTNNAPTFALSDKQSGYGFKMINHTPWRTFTLRDPKTKVTVIVAERFNSRHAFGRSISNDYLITILFAYPILGLLIWSIVGRGLGSLKRVTHEVSHRDPSFLEPVDVQSVPLEIKPLVEELNQLFHRLAEAFEREKRFAGDAAHELRTPLAALKTQAQVILKSMKDSHSLVNIIAGVDRCTHIVEQLLILSRLVPESAATIHDVTEFNLDNVITETLAVLVNDALEKQIEIEFVNQCPGLKIEGNATAVAILTRNLVDNAIRYTPEAGTVKVFLFNEGDYVRLRVQDNGPGIPEQLRKRVFERFYRVLGNKSPGSGLGLAIVQQITALHQGSISLSSPKDGSGLVIDVVLPKHPPQKYDLEDTEEF